MTDENKKHFKRVVSEMTSSEKVHLRGLEILNEVYLKPIVMSDNKEWSSIAKKIQSDISTLINVHKRFLEMMEEGQANAKGDSLPVFGDKFIKNLQFLKMASSYINKYPQYLEQMTTMTNKEKDIVKAQNKAKEQYMKEHPDVKNIQAISFYLITPIQRIPRYELLIRDMLKDTGKDYEGLEKLKTAYQEAKKSSEGANSLKIQSEENYKVLLMRDIIKGGKELAKDASGRRYICSGPMFVVPNLKDKPKDLYYFFLFKDIFVQTKVKKLHGESIKKMDSDMAHFVYNKVMDMEDFNGLADCVFESEKEWKVNAGWKLVQTKGTEEVPFVINLFMGNTCENCKFAVNSEEERDVWESVLFDQIVGRRKTLENIAGRKRHVTIDTSNTNHSTTATLRQKFIEPDSEYLKYKAPSGGVLINNGDIMKNVIKTLESNADQSTNNIEEFFKQIDSRTMTDENKKHFKRVVSEMTSSEKVHLRGLEILNEVYLKPIVMSDNKEWSSIAKKIQSDISTLINVHKRFLEMMEEGQANAKGDSLPVFGDKFIKNLQFLKMASSYINKYPQYLEQMTNHLKKEKDLLKAQEKAKEQYMKEHPETKSIQAISFYLITPIQRIPRYELLIRDMLKDTGKDYEGLEKLKTAYQEAKKSSEGANSLKIQSEENDKVEFILSLIDADFGILPSRRFICCGPMYLTNNLVSKPTQWNYFFLFSDRLIGTVIKKYHGKEVRDEKVMEEAIEEINKIGDYQQLQDFQFAKEIDALFTEGSGIYLIEDCEMVKNMVSCKLNQIPYKFSCETKEECEAWNSLIFDQVERVNVLAKKKVETVKAN
ncbi:Rho/RAC guanine nucleotide exchange factor, putative [Entamoeba dispar SAW760]|uniref:Rho/RAC guanine nucleotide exchange factor, putative n=1 Tax=Entamoeba dispar (strain ATCC PRA-260 / SAW760) TaxID=370354 RepID=B0EK27_ENTDS|nr:Rho/RAC guanine nucleotide exchange factor, putative [Entamoeba dispar SAW760]EDR25095.1 Rho/RAC guanine nucleotide exchange factor, putative [Entamoeba dispar SAW760]|eukprot:EDR25095.1 Rho/RAC guanine nucleotide exchange factor, putative [Entamoeba dispar SAW760]